MTVRSSLWLLMWVPTLALASVGKVTALEGKAQRVPEGAAAEPVAIGSALELHDQVKLEAGAFLKLTLNDGSVLALGPQSVLQIDDAQFAGQERRSFSAKLWVGQFWAHVSKALAGSNAKFEVTTERAVAGVRGTIFRVDAVAVVDRSRQGRAGPGAIDRTVVKVTEGKVGVNAEIKKKTGAKAAKLPGPRHEVAGPQEISVEEWEKRFAELQANQQVVVGTSSFQQSTFNPAKKDAFDRFVDKP